MHYPDPFNRLAFEDHLDRRPAHRLSLTEVRDEKAHWAGWVMRNGLVGNEPAATGGTTRQAWAATLAGSGISLLGPLGYVSGLAGNVLTGAGFLAAVWGLLLSARLRAERAPSAAAAERVDFRLEELVARRRALLERH